MRQSASDAHASTQPVPVVIVSSVTQWPSPPSAQDVSSPTVHPTVVHWPPGDSRWSLKQIESGAQPPKPMHGAPSTAVSLPGRHASLPIDAPTSESVQTWPAGHALPSQLQAATHASQPPTSMQTLPAPHSSSV